MRISLSFLCFLFAGGLAGQATSLADFNPDDILVAGDQLPKVLLVGSFHFNYPNLDAHKTAAEDQVDVKDARRSAELRELLDYIATFKPTKIVIERRAGSTVNDRYRDYLAGNFELPKSEVYQIGFRLGKRFGIDSLVIGDAFTFSNSLHWHRDSLILRPLLDSIFRKGEPDPDTRIARRYTKLYNFEDQQKADHSLLEIFRYLNDPHRIRRGHGHYLEFTSDLDPDALAIWWYSRNLRIYRNVQRATTSPEDRILVLFGAGHLGILRQQFESSPAYDLVDFADLADH